MGVRHIEEHIMYKCFDLASMHQIWPTFVPDPHISSHSPPMAESNEGSYRGRGTWRARGRGTTHPEQAQGQQNRGTRGWRSSGWGRGSSGSTLTSSSVWNAAPQSNNAGNRSGAAAATQAKRQMELMPSISRSSGLDKDGDS